MKTKLLMLDLCSGLGGASAAMSNRGWSVIRVDIDPCFAPDVVANVREWSYEGSPPDLIWASPPCTEFSRESMPWCRTGKTPDMSIVLACKRIIQECNPRFWIIENVRGAIRWFQPHFGEPAARYGPFYLWGHFPPLGDFCLDYRRKESYNSKQQAERAFIPYQLSFAVAQAVELQQPLPF